MLKFAENLIDWYWQHGIRRQGSYAIDAKWLDKAYECQRLAALAEEARTRPTLAVWGPSASGKSTLISPLIDESDGKDSALNWSGAPPFTFVGHEGGAKAIPLNPWNRGKDASACVSRFILRSEKEIADRHYPVRLTFGTHRQILHALASGYLSETDTKNSEGDTISFEANPFIERLGRKTTGSASNRELFETLHEFADVLGELIRAGHPRFSRLGDNDRWGRAIRSEMLGTSRLLADKATLDQFVFDVLWNGNPVLTELYRDLEIAGAPFMDPNIRDNVYCSLETAALLIDMEAYNSMQATSAELAENVELARRADLVRRLSWTQRDGVVLIGRDLERPLLKTQRDLGLLQGIVWEIEVPLRREYLMARAQDSDACRAFLTFLEKADLVDFPGVANEDEKAEGNRIKMQEVTADRKELFTEMLKRGKTSSIVSAYTRSLAIDEFLILVRSERFTVKPRQIESQIVQWWNTADPSFQPRRGARLKPPLPLKIGMTFFANTIDNCRTGIGKGLGPLFDLLDRLGDYTDPELSTLFTVSYPAFRDGIILADDAELQRIVRDIKGEQHFRKRFANDVSLGSFDATVSNARRKDQDGGVGYLFHQLATISAAPKAAHLQKIKAGVRSDLDALMAECLPPAADGPRPGDRLEEFKRAVAAYVKGAPDHEELERCAECGLFIRKIVDFTADDLDPLPTNVPQQTRSRVLRDYVGRQFEKWKARKAHVRPPAEGFEGVDIRQFAFALGDLTLQECSDDLTRWLRETLGHVDNLESARHVREYIALALSNAVFRGASSEAESLGTARRPGDFTRERRVLEFMRQTQTEERTPRGYSADLETVLSFQSPDYRLVIAPFLRRLELLASASPLERKPQPGDDEIKALYAGLGQQGVAVPA